MRSLFLLLLGAATLAGLVWKMSQDAGIHRPREMPQVRTFELEGPSVTPPVAEPLGKKKPRARQIAKVEKPEKPAALAAPAKRILDLPLVPVEPARSPEPSPVEETVAAVEEFEPDGQIAETPVDAAPSIDAAAPIDQEEWGSLIRRMLALYGNNR